MADTVATPQRTSALAYLDSTKDLTMSSREIADLVEARHDNVKVTVDRLVAKGVIAQPALQDEQNSDSLGRPRVTQVYQLKKRDCFVVVAQLSPEFTARVVDRWQELETRVSRPMSHLEVVAANAMALVEIERQQHAILEAQNRTAADVARIESRVQEVAILAEATGVWDHCPQNCEPITKIRARVQDQYGIPAWVVDTVMRELPLSPKVHGMVRNGHEDAKGSHYEVWAVSDVTRVFRRFIGECVMETEHTAHHPDIGRRFRIKPGIAAVSVHGGAR